MHERNLWLAVGVVIVLLTGIIAAPNLHDIYAAQKDFVVGGMLSLAGYSFGKAVDKSDEARERWLHVKGVYDTLKEIESAVKGASEALWRIDEPSVASVAVECHKRLAKSSSLLTQLRNTVLPTDGRWTFTPAQHALLGKLDRDLDAAVDRLYSSRIELLAHLDTERDEAAWALFFVLVDDLVKVQERLDVVGRKKTDVPVESQLYIIEGYLRAAQRRSAEFTRILEEKSIRRPDTFGVMCLDVDDALTELGRMGTAALPSPDSQPRRWFRRLTRARSTMP